MVTIKQDITPAVITFTTATHVLMLCFGAGVGGREVELKAEDSNS
ncbi:TPA: hypothetical protein ACWYG7_004673 [Citrobacter braakii]